MSPIALLSENRVEATDLRQHPQFELMRHSPEEHYILAQQYNNLHPPPPHQLLVGQQQQQQQQLTPPAQLHSPQDQDKYHPNNPAAYRSDHPVVDYHHREQIYQQLDSANNNNNNNNNKVTLGLHLNDSNGDYDETMSNNEDNCSVKDLSPGGGGLQPGSKLNNDPTKGYTQAALRAYADSCDISTSAQMNKSSYECSANGIRPRNFKEMQSPNDGMETGGGGGGGVGNAGTNGNMGGYMDEEHHRMGKSGGEGGVNNNGNLRTYSSSEDLNQTISSEHGGEKITSGSDDEGGLELLLCGG